MSDVGPVPVISFVGKSGVGKTTVLVRVISEIKRRGNCLLTDEHLSADESKERAERKLGFVAL